MVVPLILTGLIAKDAYASALAERFTPLRHPDSLTGKEKAAIRKAIGNRRIVMLGELTHGDGTAFRFKVAFVEFLHKEMGFDALIWESGLYDCAEMDRELAGAKPIQDVARMGVFSHWSGGAESLPIFDYCRSTARSARPLRMTGFDLQPSGASSNYMLSDITQWFDDCGGMTPELRHAVQDAIASVRSANLPDAFAKAQLKVYRLANIFDERVELDQPFFRKSWGSEYAFRRQVIKNAMGYAKILEAIAAQSPMSSGYNIREKANAENLGYLLNGPLSGKKVVVWAHNAHIFRGLPGVGAGPSLKPRPGDLDSMTRIAAGKWDKQIFSLGVMAQQGKWSWLGGEPISYQLPAEGSIESKLAGMGHRFGFVDLTGVAKASPLHHAVPGIIDQQNPFVLSTDWTQGFDGILYIGSMEPRTQLPNP